MDVEDQWEKAVHAMGCMSNLEISLVWQKLSSAAVDFRIHSEYKCLFKRAVREVESRLSVTGCKRSSVLRGVVGDFCNNDACSVRYEYPGHGHVSKLSSRENSGSIQDEYSAVDKADLMNDLMKTIELYGIREDMRNRLMAADCV
jgi:hypothetical protein